MAAIAPGVHVREVPSGNQAISGASTSLGLFVGMAPRGPVDEPVLVTDLRTFKRIFGDTDTEGELPAQVQQFFLNGGRSTWVLRIARDTAAEPLRAAQITVEDETGTERLRLRARSEGAADNVLRAVIDYNTATPDGTFNLVVYREVLLPPDRLVREAVETHTNLTMDLSAPNAVTTVLQDRSQLVEAEVLDGAAVVAPGDNLTPGTGLSVSGARFEDLAAADGAVATALAQGAPQGTFRVALGATPARLVTVTTGTVAGIQAAAQAVVGGGVTVTFRDGAIVFAAAGQDIHITPGDAEDISEALGLGLPAGLEVGAFAQYRPRPNGLVLPRYEDGGGYDPAGALDGLGGDRADLAQIRISGGDARYQLAAQVPAWVGSEDRVDEIDTADDRSLTAVRQQLTAIGQQIQAANGNWGAEVHGNRLVLYPTAAGAVEGHGSVIEEATGPTQLSTRGVAAYGFDTSTAAFPDTGHTATAGADGAPPDLATYQAAFERAERAIPTFNLLVLPRTRGTVDGRQSAWGAATSMCVRKRALLLVDPPATWTGRSQALAGIAALRAGAVRDHCAVYWPRIDLADGMPVDPSGSVAGLMARIDASHGVWQAAAGDIGTLLNVRGVRVPVSDTDTGFLNEQAINVVRAFPTGILAWGARTMDGFDNSGNTDYRYTSVRRLALFLASSLEAGLRFAVFKPNDEQLWGQVRATVRAFMAQQWRRGAFAGSSEDEAFFVKCDGETTSQLDIDLGFMNVEIGFAPVKPAEFVEVTLRQLAGQAQI
jgi:uncharacterized protein